MSESKPWTDQWFKAQQQFVDAWSEMAKANGVEAGGSQTDLWSEGFEMWRKACGGQTQPDAQAAMQKCLDMGKEYFAMAEQVGKSISEGKNPVDAITQWLEQLKSTLQQFSGVAGFNGANVGDFMQQWFSPNAAWQDMVSKLLPLSQAGWQFPGMNAPAFNMGEAIDPIGRVLQSPGIGYFREPQEKQQKGLQLALEYHEANNKFNQAFLRIALESIEGFQSKLMTLDGDNTPKSLRELYDLWVEVSEAHYAEFAMSEEYQALYGDMVNKLMIMKKHYSEITDDFLRAMNLPNTSEVDTMQKRLQQLRRENFSLKKEIREIRELVQRVADRPAAKPQQASKRVVKKAFPKKAAVKKAASKVSPKKTAAKPAMKKPSIKKSAAKKKAAGKPRAGARS